MKKEIAKDYVPTPINPVVPSRNDELLDKILYEVVQLRKDVAALANREGVNTDLSHVTSEIRRG